MKLTDEQRRMVENNVKLVYSCLRNVGYVGNRQDVEQELMMELCKAAYRYDASKGTQFSTYAVSCIKSKIRTIKAKRGLWSATRQFKKGQEMYVGFEVTSLNRKIDGNDEELELMDIIPSTETPMEDQVLARIEIDRFAESLTGNDKTIIEMRMQGYTYQEIADKIGISETHACRRVKKLVQKLNS